MGMDERDHSGNLSKALNRFTREDPTLQCVWDDEAKENILSGMGELHLEIYAQRMLSEYGVNVTLGKPKVAFRETITNRVDFDYTHKRQSGGHGQFGRLIGYVEPLPDDQNTQLVFKDETVGTNVPQQYMRGIKKGFLEDSTAEGILAGCPVTGVKVVVLDGASHLVDSSEIAFKLCAQGAFKQAMEEAGKCVLKSTLQLSFKERSCLLSGRGKVVLMTKIV